MVSLRTSPSDALVDLWISMEFLVSKMKGRTMLTSEGVADLHSIIELGKIRKDSSGNLMDDKEMKIVADRVRNKVNQIDLRQRFNDFCAKYGFSPTEEENKKVWGKVDLETNATHWSTVCLPT